MAPQNIPANTAILENLWIQYGALGVLFGVLLAAVILLYRINRKKDDTHKGEWEQLRLEQREDREKSDRRHDEKAELFINTMTESSAKFAIIIEGSLKENNQFLIENKVALNNFSKN